MDNIKDIATSAGGESANSNRNVTRRILRADGNTVKLSVVSLLCILTLVLMLMLSSWFVMFFIGDVQNIESIESNIVVDIGSVASFAVLVGGFIFVFLPLVSGVMCFAKRTVDGEKPRFYAVLEPFLCKDEKRYFSFVLLPLAIALRVAIILLPLAGGIINVWRIFTDATGTPWFMMIADSAFVLALTVLAIAVGVYISSYFFFVPYLIISGKMSFFSAFAASVKMAKTRKAEIAKQTLSQAPCVLWSVLSFLVLWVILAAPRMLVSYFVYCNEIENNE